MAREWALMKKCYKLRVREGEELKTFSLPCLFRRVFIETYWLIPNSRLINFTFKYLMTIVFWLRNYDCSSPTSKKVLSNSFLLPLCFSCITSKSGLSGDTDLKWSFDFQLMGRFLVKFFGVLFFKMGDFRIGSFID